MLATSTPLFLLNKPILPRLIIELSILDLYVENVKEFLAFSSSCCSLFISDWISFIFIYSAFIVFKLSKSFKFLLGDCCSIVNPTEGSNSCTKTPRDNALSLLDIDIVEGKIIICG